MIVNFTIRTAGIALTEDRDSEVSRMLRETADKIENGRDSGTLIDYNGNTVGHWSISE